MDFIKSRESLKHITEQYAREEKENERIQV